jgi:hypothetical protein
MNYETAISQAVNATVDECNKVISKKNQMVHIRALFNYVPQDDMYIPCKELGLAFSKGDIIHIISQVCAFFGSLKKIYLQLNN